jgi:hypothetical protein
MSIDTPNIETLEAAKYLNLEVIDFNDYVKRGLICYIFKYSTRFFSRNELNRFKREVLERDNKL